MEGSQTFIYRCAPRGTRTGTTDSRYTNEATYLSLWTLVRTNLGEFESTTKKQIENMMKQMIKD